MKKAIALVSGGLDSCVTAAIAEQKYQLALLHINYGQRTETKELEAFHKIADFYKVKERLVCNLKWLKEIGGSSLTDEKMEIPEQIVNRKSLTANCIPTTYVPFRNANFLCIAVSWAEVIKASKVFIGAVASDAPEYPDTRKNFFTIFNKLVKYATVPVEIETPIVGLKKYEVVKLGMKLGAPLHLTWSCYKSNKTACGKCASCVRRAEAFEKARAVDKLKSQRSKIKTTTQKLKLY